MTDYKKTARALFADLLFTTGNINETLQDIRNYRDKILGFRDFQRKYGLKYKSRETLDGSLRRMYKKLEESTSILEKDRGKQIRLAYQYVSKRKTIAVGIDVIDEDLNEWIQTICRKYKPQFTNEWYSNLPLKNYGGIGFFKHLSFEGIEIRDFLKNLVKYIHDSLDLIIDIRNYFNSKDSKCFFMSADYTEDSNRPLCIRIRMFLEEKYSGKEKICTTGYLSIGTYLKETKEIFEKYYKSAIDKRTKYNDKPEFWRVIYLCIDTHLLNEDKFTKEQGFKSSFYYNGN